MKNNKSYCFVNFDELIINNSLTNEEINLVERAQELNIPFEYQYIIMVFDSKFNGPSFWYPERNHIYEYTTGHLFDASKSKLIKDNDTLYVTNINSFIYKNFIFFNTWLKFKTIEDVGSFFDKLIINNHYYNYRLLLQEIFRIIVIDDEEDLIYEMKRTRNKLVC